MGPRGLMRPPHVRGSRPESPAPLSSPAQSKPAPSSTSSTLSASSSSSGPTPLFAIETPDQVKAVVDHKIEQERAHEMAQRQEVQRRRRMLVDGGGGGVPAGGPPPPPHSHGMVRGVKRSYGDSSSGGGGPPPSKYLASSGPLSSGSRHAPPHQHQHQQPPSLAQQQQPSSSTVVRSNLRQIQCVDEPMASAPPQRPQQASSSVPRRTPGSNLITLTHNPSPSNITINTTQPQQQLQRNGNLVSIPLGGGGGGGRPQPRQQHPAAHRPPLHRGGGGGGCKVLVTNLPASATFDRLSQMTTACGAVRTLRLEAGRAVIEFAEPSAADRFYKSNNRKMMDLSILQVARLA